VLRLRVRRAEELLAATTLSLTEIALECGFSSHSHLTRMFRKTVGSTPSDYRRERRLDKNAISARSTC
jgi:AraC family transcriptional regulator